MRLWMGVATQCALQLYAPSRGETSISRKETTNRIALTTSPTVRREACRSCHARAATCCLAHSSPGVSGACRSHHARAATAALLVHSNVNVQAAGVGAASNSGRRACLRSRCGYATTTTTPALCLTTPSTLDHPGHRPPREEC